MHLEVIPHFNKEVQKKGSDFHLRNRKMTVRKKERRGESLTSKARPWRSGKARKKAPAGHEVIII